MPAWWLYFRKHPWQRRLFTGSLTLLLGGLAGLWAFPHIRDHLLLRDLASRRAGIRSAAIWRGVQLARQSPHTLGRLNAALDGADDAQFAAIVAVLKWLGEFNVPARDVLHVDRMRALELAGNPSAEMRAIFLGEVLLSGRDNRYVRQGLAAASRDANAELRARSGALASRVGDEATLAALLADADPNVAAAAALDAGIGRHIALKDKLRGLLEARGDPACRSAAAYALARTDPNGGAEPIGRLLDEADQAGDGLLRDRLLHAACELGEPGGGPAVRQVFRRAAQAGRHPPAAALAAAGRLGLADLAPDVRGVLRAAVRPGSGLSARQALAAMRAAEALRMPVRREARDICEALWTHRPAFRLMLEEAARLLGRQAAMPQGDEPNAPSRAECVQTLRKGVVQDFPPTTWPADKPPPLIRPPLPSAAAAVALWELDADLEDRELRFIRIPAGDEFTLAGDYVSWHLGLVGGRREFQLGLELLPDPDAPADLREYNNERRCTGALLLAMAARTGEQRELAAERIRARLVGGRMGAEDNYYVRGAYRCALAILGDGQELREVKGLLETGEFSQRRAITALTLAGSMAGLDWLLWNPQVDPDDQLYLLVDELVGDVLAACLPGLPGVDPSAEVDLAAWQLRILRDTYAIRRASLRPAFPPTRPR